GQGRTCLVHDPGGNPPTVVTCEAEDAGAISRQFQKRADRIGVEDAVDLGDPRGWHLAGRAVDVPAHCGTLALVACDPDEPEPDVTRPRDRDCDGDGLGGEFGSVERDDERFEHVPPLRTFGARRAGRTDEPWLTSRPGGEPGARKP